jgi:hypothetical protein
MDNADIQAKLDVIKSPSQSVIDAADAIPPLIDAATSAARDEGFAAGQASIILPSPTLPNGEVDPALKYTQDDMDKAFVQAKSEQLAVDQPQIDSLSAAVVQAQADLAAAKAANDALQSDLDVKVKAGVDAGVAAFKAAELPKLLDLEAKIKELEADNT